LSSTILDVGRDDYYGFLAAQHGGGSFDVETSGWLTHLPQFQLSVGHSGNGNVDVTGPAGRRACGDSCSLTLDNGTAVTLTAEPGPGSRLVAWQGSCAGSQPTCGVTADAAKSVTAQFGPATKPFFLTSEFLVFILLIIALILAVAARSDASSRGTRLIATRA
jgi:Divergent InlB B-repeat domain